RANYHIHTHHSPCGSGDMVLPSILDAAEKAGYDRIGISDHCYSFDLNSSRIKELRAEVAAAADERGIRVYLGIEAYVIRHHLASISHQIAALFDFVLVAPNHYHIRSVAKPVRMDPRILADHELYMFEAAANHPVTDVVAHPFILSPRIFRIAAERLAALSEDVMASVDEKRLALSLDRMRERGLAVELNPKFITFGQDHVEWFYRLCVERDVLLSIGNDAHSLDEVALSDDAQKFIDSLGLSEANLWNPLSFD
ncbi:PHP domain-containing protein, partial [Candidatus Poribacteria bacterium]|nr:PHP domain-containing protein [Candidatus Poribacteria bacterium]